MRIRWSHTHFQHSSYQSELLTSPAPSDDGLASNEQDHYHEIEFQNPLFVSIPAQIGSFPTTFLNITLLRDRLVRLLKIHSRMSALWTWHLLAANDHSSIFNFRLWLPESFFLAL